jgi:hypothetical protein
MFFIKAIFYTLIVAAFVPAGFYAAEDGMFAQETTRIAADFQAGEARDSMGATVSSASTDFCAERAEVCQVAGELLQFTGFVVDVAADRAEDALANPSRQSRVERTVLTADELFREAAGEIPTR